MLNSTQNSLIIKPTTLKFLYEIAAIPLKTREEFLTNLLKRKNASNQKNVKLLILIYSHLAENKMLEWNDEGIRVTLALSKESYYYHKSILLKGLRLLYFNWKKIEEKEFSDKTKYKDGISLNFARAEKMNRLGMRKEARILFFKILHFLTKKIRKTRQDYNLLFNSIKYLCYHYHRIKNYKKFNFYLKKLEKYGKYIIKIQPELKSDVMTFLYMQRSAKIKFFADKTTTAASSAELSKLALVEARKARNYREEALILLNLCGYFRAIKKIDQSIKYSKLGLELGQRTKKMDIYFTFKSGLAHINYSAGKINKDELHQEIKILLNNLNHSDNSAMCKQATLFNIFQLANLIGNEEIFNKYMYDYSAREIIYNGLNSSLRILYFMKWTNYLKNVPEIKVEGDLKSGKIFLNVKNTNEKYNRKLDNSVMELTINTNNIRDIVFRMEFFTIMLLADFWKGKNCSIEYSKHIYQQFEWIIKTRPELSNSNKNLIENTYWGINLMSDSKVLNYEDFLNKYEQKFKEHSNEIIESNAIDKLTLYYMLSYIAEQSGYSQLKQIAKDTFFKLEKKHPEEIKSIINDIKEKQNSENELTSPANFKAA